MSVKSQILKRSWKSVIVTIRILSGTHNAPDIPHPWRFIRPFQSGSFRLKIDKVPLFGCTVKIREESGDHWRDEGRSVRVHIAVISC